MFLEEEAKRRNQARFKELEYTNVTLPKFYAAGINGIGHFLQTVINLMIQWASRGKSKRSFKPIDILPINGDGAEKLPDKGYNLWIDPKTGETYKFKRR